MKFKKKPVVIAAITFDELVAHGRASGANIVNGMPWSFQYQGQPISHENDQCYLIPTLEGNMKFTPDDMLITGVKGEIYPCKRDIFAATYEAAEALGTGLTFGQAIEAMKKGQRVARAGWNGKGMFLFLVPGSTFQVSRPPLLGIYPEGTTVNYCPHIDMKTADDKVVPWLASQTDMLADDWCIVV